MLEAGALEEVRALERRKLDPLLPAMKAHGVPWLIRHLNGETRSGRSCRRCRHGHPPLRQTPAHLVPQSDEGLAGGDAGRSGCSYRTAAYRFGLIPDAAATGSRSILSNKSISPSQVWADRHQNWRRGTSASRCFMVPTRME